MKFLKFCLIFYVLPRSIPDPFHGFMKWIWILPNDTDPIHCTLAIEIIVEI